MDSFDRNVGCTPPGTVSEVRKALMFYSGRQYLLYDLTRFGRICPQFLHRFLRESWIRRWQPASQPVSERCSSVESGRRCELPANHQGGHVSYQHSSK